jgi:hypothetical protein
MADWDWRVTCYYARTVAPPKVPGELAIQTVHRGEHSRDMELAVGAGRTDIGRITVESSTAGRWVLTDDFRFWPCGHEVRPDIIWDAGAGTGTYCPECGANTATGELPQTLAGELAALRQFGRELARALGFYRIADWLNRRLHG